MPKWWFAPTKYVIWPGSHCNCICKPAEIIACAFAYSSRSPAYASIHCGCPSQEQLAHSHSFPQWIVQSFFMKPVGMSATPYCFITLYSGLKNRWISYLYPLEVPQIQNLGIPRICLKCTWQRDLKTFQHFLSRKCVFWRNSNYCGKPLHFLSAVGWIFQAVFTFSKALKRQTFQLVFLETSVFSTMGKYPFSTCL